MPKRRPAVTILQLSRVLKLEPCVVYRWVKKGTLPVMRLRSYHNKGNFIVKREDAVWLIHNWKRTCTPTEAARKLNTTDGAVRYYIRKNILRSVKISGLNRIVVSLIPEVEKFIGKDVINPDLVGFARYAPEKRREMSKVGHMSHWHHKFTLADRQKGALRMNQVLI